MSRPKPPPAAARLAERQRVAAWLGLYGTARTVLDARTETERRNASERMLRYVSKLEEAGVKAPEESA
jgi:hypothetical protein